jgi:subtilisin family serine protease
VVDSASYAPEAFDGTSAAAPHVSGAAALIRQAFPEFGPDEIAAFLKDRAVDLGPFGADTAFGVGRLYLGEAPREDSAEPPGKELPDENATPDVGLPAPPEGGNGAEASLPDQVSVGGEAGQPPPAGRSEDDGLTVMVSVGLCLICLGGLLLVGLVVAGLVVMRRR